VDTSQEPATPVSEETDAVGALVCAKVVTGFFLLKSKLVTSPSSSLGVHKLMSNDED
jgi:hypothetical protein